MNHIPILTLLAFMLMLPLTAQAETPPLPPRKNDLPALEKSLKQQSQTKEELETQIKNIESELNETRQRLVDVAASVQENETALGELEVKIKQLEGEKSQIETTLDDNRQSISQLILALERIRRIPPEALVVKPDAPLKTAQSAKLMRDIMPVIYEKAQSLEKNLTALENISKDLSAKHERAFKTAEALRAEQLNLTSLIQRREELYKTTRDDLATQEEKVRRISLQAENLQDLVTRLDQDEQQERTRSQSAPTKATAYSKGGIPSPGRVQLPISGVITTRFKEPDHFGAPSMGISIEGRGGALIVAPMGGVVRFAGFFKNYGNLVILEHEGGYHSLVAGLEKIDTVVGQSVSAGEPLGVLHHSSSGEKPALYYELRQGGKPINPAKKFTDLG
jgi:septal ring factor EnvC (AmiA/AmiB activator)